MEKIKDIKAREILDSRGNPTLSVEVFTTLFSGKFDVPSGASTGVNEAHELRDGDLKRYGGLGVLKAQENIKKKILPALRNIEITNQKKIDSILVELDGTEDKSNLGANAILGVSIASAKAAAQDKRQELFLYLRDMADIKASRETPYLFINLINGGKHSQSNIAFQEYMIVPQSNLIKEAIHCGCLIKNEIKKIILENFGNSSANIGDEGGYVPNCKNVIEPLEILSQAIRNCGMLQKVKLALDVAASSFYKSNYYEIDKKKIDKEDLFLLYQDIINNFQILSIEDPFHEKDFDSFADLKKVSQNILVVGDDLTVTNKACLQKAIDKDSINGIIIKPNQIGTLSETLETMQLARDNGIKLIISHRSGETNDDFIVDLAAAFRCFGLKLGAPQRGERIAKYNRLLEIYGSDIIHIK